MDVLLNPYLTNASSSNLTYLLRKLFNVVCLINVVLNLSNVTLFNIVLNINVLRSETVKKKKNEILFTCDYVKTPHAESYEIFYKSPHKSEFYQMFQTLFDCNSPSLHTIFYQCTLVIGWFFITMTTVRQNQGIFCLSYMMCTSVILTGQ